jgi:oligoribonuclease
LASLGIKQEELILAGNSVHVDKMFLMKQMPQLNAFVNYRILDVSSVKTVVNVTKPKLFYKKKQGHRALDDIR